MAQFCGHCGAPAQPQHRFCGSCGAPLATTGPRPAGPPAAGGPPVAVPGPPSAAPSAPGGRPSDEELTRPASQLPHRGTIGSAASTRAASDRPLPAPDQPTTVRPATSPRPAAPVDATIVRPIQPPPIQPPPRQPPRVQPQFGVPPSGGPPPGPAIRSKRWLWLGLAVLVVLAVVAVTGILLWRSEDRATDPATGRQIELPEPVTGRPEQAWTWRTPGDGSLLSTVAEDDAVYLSYYTDSGAQVVALSHGGEEAWSQAMSTGDYLIGVADDSLLVGPSEDATGVCALDVEDGTTRWCADTAWTALTVDEGVLTVSDGEIALLDSESGTRRWQVPMDNYGLSAEALYVVAGDELRRIELRTGAEDWAVATGLDDDWVTVSATDDVVAVSGADQVRAFDTDDHSLAWSDGGDIGSVGVALDDWIYVARYGDENADGEVRFFDAAGQQALLPTDPESYFSPVSFHTDGEAYLFDGSSGILYRGEELDLVRQYRGTFTPVRDGAYVVNQGTLTYHRFADPQPVWELPLVAEDEYVTVIPTDGAVYADLGQELRCYR